MSINDLIHTNAHNAFEQGKQTEQERIIKLIESLGCQFDGIEHDCGKALGNITAEHIIALIKGEQK